MVAFHSVSALLPAAVQEVTLLSAIKKAWSCKHSLPPALQYVQSLLVRAPAEDFLACGVPTILLLATGQAYLAMRLLTCRSDPPARP